MPVVHATAAYTGTVQFTSSDGQAVLPANYTFSAADQGVHTFSATLKTADSQSVTATDTLSHSITGTQAGIVVSLGAATTLKVDGLAASVQAGLAQNFTLTAQDAFANTATGFSGTVHFLSTDHRAELPADYSFTSGDRGVHVFHVTFHTPGVQTLSPTSPSSSHP